MYVCFTMQHALSLLRGCFHSTRHNELCSLTASLRVATDLSMQLITSKTFSAASVNRPNGACKILLPTAFGEVLMNEPFLMPNCIWPMGCDSDICCMIWGGIQGSFSSPREVENSVRIE